jgi:hypothetical protein
MKKIEKSRFVKSRLLSFEHKRDELVPFPVFMVRVLRYSFFAFVMIVFSLGIGTFGYHFFGKLGYMDSFYNASMILTGMGPVSVMATNNAKLFSSIYALYSGIAFLSITAIFLSPVAHRLLHILHIESRNQENQ